jgi:hypothetical protein
MSRRPASVLQADIARALRAARQCGAGPVRILPGGTILIDLRPEPVGDKAQNPPVPVDVDLVVDL